jgi:DNA invertase Pin-like site-specific DNA recombinase
MKCAIYARVSTKNGGQDPLNQVVQLREYCQKQGWDIVNEYIDQKSGKNSDREQFQAMFDAAYRRQFDVVLFWSLDRFSREGVLETLQHLQKLTSYGVAFKSYTEQYP